MNKPTAGNDSKESIWRRLAYALFAVVGGGLAIAILVWMYTHVIASPGNTITQQGGSGTGFSPEVMLPVLVVGSTLVLLISMAVIAVAFRSVGLAAPDQPLGLPQGSIQALIALSLIMIFTISAVYLFGRLQTPDVSTLTSLTAEQTGQFSTRIVAIRPAKAQGGAQPLYDVDLRNDANQAAVDMAKQIMTMVGTLLVTVIGFYFGARSAATAASEAASGAASAVMQQTAAMQGGPQGSPQVPRP